MVVPIMCLVVMCFLGWILLLKSEVERLGRENLQLRNALQHKVGRLTGDVEVREGRKLNAAEVRKVEHGVLSGGKR